MIIDFEENKGRFYFENDEIIYEKSECLERIFKLLHSRIQSEEVEKRKNYLILVASLSSKFMRKKVDKVVFDLIFPFIAFHLEFKVIITTLILVLYMFFNSDRMKTLQMQVCSNL